MYVITLCENVNAMVARGLALVDAGKYKHLIRRNKQGKLDFHGFFCPVAYKDNRSLGYGSLSQAEIHGDSENGIASFIDEMGFICLNCGDNGVELYDGMSAENKALYESIKPRIKITDIEGNETGETRADYLALVDI